MVSVTVADAVGQPTAETVYVYTPAGADDGLIVPKYPLEITAPAGPVQTPVVTGEPPK